MQSQKRTTRNTREGISTSKALNRHGLSAPRSQRLSCECECEFWRASKFRQLISEPPSLKQKAANSALQRNLLANANEIPKISSLLRKFLANGSLQPNSLAIANVRACCTQRLTEIASSVIPLLGFLEIGLSLSLWRFHAYFPAFTAKKGTKKTCQPLHACKFGESPAQNHCSEDQAGQNPPNKQAQERNLQGLKSWAWLTFFPQNLSSTGILPCETLRRTFLQNSKGSAQLWGTLGARTCLLGTGFFPPKAHETVVFKF